MKDKTSSCASSPCLAHEVIDTSTGVMMVDPQQSLDVARWRKAERVRLTNMRQSIDAGARRQNSQTIIEQLNQTISLAPGMIVSVYWPIMGEPNLRQWMQALVAAGTRVVLPVVVSPNSPMIFREWTPYAIMEPGIWNIPIPVDGEILIPTTVISPVVGFDAANYRLGNGGGYFDRTLAELIATEQRPYVIGVGYQCLQIPTIFPQPHDIPMDVIITETTTHN